MVEIRKTTDKEKAKHGNMPYLLDLGHIKQWFSEKAMIELAEKSKNAINDLRLGVVRNSCFKVTTPSMGGISSDVMGYYKEMTPKLEEDKIKYLLSVEEIEIQNYS